MDGITFEKATGEKPRFILYTRMKFYVNGVEYISESASKSLGKNFNKITSISDALKRFPNACLFMIEEQTVKIKEK